MRKQSFSSSGGRGTITQSDNISLLTRDILNHFLRPELCPQLVASMSHYELQVNMGRRRMSSSNFKTTSSSSDTENSDPYLRILRSDGYWFEVSDNPARGSAGSTRSSIPKSIGSRPSSGQLLEPTKLEVCREGPPLIGSIEDNKCEAGPHPEIDAKNKPISGLPELSSEWNYEIEYHESESYRRFFVGFPHYNFFTHTSPDSKTGPCLLSIMPCNDANLPAGQVSTSDHHLIILRSCEHYLHGIVNARDLHANDVITCVQGLTRALNLKENFRLTDYPKAQVEILNMDEAFVNNRVKVGVINIKKNQFTEIDFLSNQDEPGLFRDFLSILGDRVELKGFTEFDGGLDVHNNTTGVYSVYSRWLSYEIMFHVATLLPYSPTDEQMVQKKRYIGNDLVCIVFLEEHVVFRPRTIKSQYIHVFIVVRILNEGENIRYKLSIVCRDGVTHFSPYISEKSLFIPGPEFRDFLMCKCINSEKAAVRCPKFQELQRRTRKYLLQHLCRKMEDYACIRSYHPSPSNNNNNNDNHNNRNNNNADTIKNSRGKVEIYDNVDRLVSDFQVSFANSDYSDIAFIIGERQIPIFGIKPILASRSTALANLLRSPPNKIHSRKKSKQSSTLPRPKKRSSSLDSQADSSIEFCFEPNYEYWREKERDTEHSTENYFIRKKARKSLRHYQQKVRTKLSTLGQLEQYYFAEFDEISFSQLMEYLLYGRCIINPLTIGGLTYASDQFELPELRQSCFEHLPALLIAELVCIILISFEKYTQSASIKTLTVKILSYIDQNATEVLNSRHFTAISDCLLTTIFQRDLCTSEIVKLSVMLAWGEAHGQTIENKNSVIIPLLRQLDLKQLPSAELLKLSKARVIETNIAMQAIAYQVDPYSIQNLP